MLSNLPTYNITIDDEYSNGENLGISKIAFVTNPAIQVKGLAFNDNKQYLFADKVKYRIVAPVMIPDQKIYRNDESGEYFVNFSQNETEKIYSKFMKNFTNRQVFNLEHDNNDKVPAYILESWIVEKPLEDKAFTSYGIQVPKGTIMLTAQITDKETYNQIVDNEQFAFSIEGFLGLSLSEIINKQKIKNEQMNEQNFDMKLPQGEFVLGDKTYIVDADGKITEKEVIKEEMADELKVEDEVKLADEPKKEEVVKEEMADAPVENAPIVEDAPKADVYTKEEVNAKFDELYQLIADMKNEEIVEDAELAPALMSEVKMSLNDRFEAMLRFNKSNKL